MSTARSDPARPAEPYSEETASILASRATIEQAKGMLMERYSIDAEAAFAVLRRHSQHTNKKLALIAAELVETRRLPEDPRSQEH